MKEFAKYGLFIFLLLQMVSIFFFVKYEKLKKVYLVSETHQVSFGEYKVNNHLEVEEPPGNRQKRYTWFAVGMVFGICVVICICINPQFI